MEEPKEASVLIPSENKSTPQPNMWCPLGVNMEFETAKKMCLWLEGALQAERQSCALAMEKRHVLLVQEYMKQHSTVVVQPSGFLCKEGGAVTQVKPQMIEEKSEKHNPEEVLTMQQIIAKTTENQLSVKKVVQRAARKCSTLDKVRNPIRPVEPEPGPEELHRAADLGQPNATEFQTLASQNADSGSSFRNLVKQGLSGSRSKKSFAKATMFGEQDVEEEAVSFLHGFVISSRFELFFIFLIVANTVVMALEAQYAGFSIGFDLKYQDYNKPSHEVWPGMKSMFRALDLAFGIVFTIELFLKICGLRSHFVYDGWNLFDALIVLGWCVDAGFRGVLPIDLMMLRLARLARLMRLLKIVKTLKGIDPLFLMITTLKGSMSILFWVFILMLVVQTMSALLMNQLLVSFYLEGDNTSDTKKDIFKYFGSFTRSMLSMFELTMGNWVPISRVLLEGVSEWFLIFTIIHKLSMGFAVLGVINGIFIQETFKVAACDDTLMMMQKQRALKLHTKRMQAFFEAADESGDGFLDHREFRAILQKAEIRTWLAAQELDASDADALFLLLDQGEQGLSAPDLVKGVSRLKGPSRSIDLTMLMHNTSQLEQKVEEMRKRLTTMEQCGSSFALKDHPFADTLQVHRAGVMHPSPAGIGGPCTMVASLTEVDLDDKRFKCTKDCI